MKDFMGVCGHYHFDGPTYAPVAAHVRNYHGINWDLDVTEPYRDPPYPFALNRVNWEHLYGGWRGAGFEINASIMIGVVKPDDWANPEESAYGYGKAFARFFGPSGKGLVDTAELGNEPGEYSDEQYRVIARAMARGLREGDPGMRIATAAITLGQSDRYARSIACYEDWLDEIDVLNVHTYAIVGQWPNRRRTHPEEPQCDYLSRVRDVIAWRDEHAAGKEVWVTEFGWDAHLAEGAAVQEGVPIDKRPSALSRTRQAQYLVRSYLIFARLGVERAYMFWYRDEGAETGLHNACGLISNGVKQPAHHALASLKANLGDYRFDEALWEDADGVYAYRFRDGRERACVAVWSPTRDGEERLCVLNLEQAGLSGFEFVRGVEPALAEGGEATVPVELDEESLKVHAAGMPRLLFFRLE
ncbi:MAG: hypothetical protein KAX19_09350 [Candidatus Brocadiae bacterium]|nr:hypothetical protein [Candidatus Brocadiia bacterium]